MAFKVFYTEPALADLQTIMAWSWEKHPETSRRFADSLLNHVDLLADFPFLEAPVKNDPGVRRLLHSPLEVYYRVNERKGLIEILHVWHISRQAPGF